MFFLVLSCSKLLKDKFSWAKENYDRNHPKYTPGTEDHWRKVELGRKRFLEDFDAVPSEERDRSRALGYYDGEMWI